MNERFLPKEIIRDLSASASASVRHFKQEGNTNKDRFGNQLLTSRDFAYLDNVEKVVKAGILISPEGQKFIADNPGILKAIDRGLFLSEIEGNGAAFDKREIDLGNGRVLQWQTKGAQSNFYVLKIDKEKYAIKTHVLSRGRQLNMYQPYINEMLQTQSLALDLKNELARLRVEMQTFLFASGQVSCTRFEKDEGSIESLLDQGKINDLKKATLEYVLEKRYNKDPLWENINIDLSASKMVLGLTLLRNFRKKLDGTVVWIDPFFYE